MAAGIRHIINCVLAIAVVVVPAYLFCAFVSFDANPAHWNGVLRAFFAMIAGVWSLAVLHGNSRLA